MAHIVKKGTTISPNAEVDVFLQGGKIAHVHNKSNKIHCLSAGDTLDSNLITELKAVTCNGSLIKIPIN